MPHLQREGAPQADVKQLPLHAMKTSSQGCACECPPKNGNTRRREPGCPEGWLLHNITQNQRGDADTLGMEGEPVTTGVAVSAGQSTAMTLLDRAFVGVIGVTVRDFLLHASQERRLN